MLGEGDGEGAGEGPSGEAGRLLEPPGAAHFEEITESSLSRQNRHTEEAVMSQRTRGEEEAKNSEGNALAKDAMQRTQRDAHPSAPE